MNRIEIKTSYDKNNTAQDVMLSDIRVVEVLIAVLVVL